MTQLNFEIQLLKAEVKEMWLLIHMQLVKTKTAFLHLDKDMALEVISSEKRVNAYELNIDRKCENIFALFNPVAVDLRYVLAVLKINSNMERIGDNIESIAKFVVNVETSFDRNLLEISRIIEMFDGVLNMMDDVIHAFDKEDTYLARTLFKKDEKLDEINIQSNSIVAKHIIENKQLIEQGLYVLSTIRKLERIGDQSLNIAEEIIFYMEAKVLKHRIEDEMKE
jgi:phosphate transport system protein